MLLYLDASCFNRPFDDQTQDRIRHETDAVLRILQRILDQEDVLVWSSALTLELMAHPEPEIRSQLLGWEHHSRTVLTSSDPVRQRAETLVRQGLKALDAAHVAFAEVGQCAAFMTCDDRLLRRANGLGLSLRVVNPVDYMQEISDAATPE